MKMKTNYKFFINYLILSILSGFILNGNLPVKAYQVKKMKKIVINSENVNKFRFSLKLVTIKLYDTLYFRLKNDSRVLGNSVIYKALKVLNPHLSNVNLIFPGNVFLILQIDPVDEAMIPTKGNYFFSIRDDKTMNMIFSQVTFAEWMKHKFTLPDYKYKPKSVIVESQPPSPPPDSDFALPLPDAKATDRKDEKFSLPLPEAKSTGAESEDKKEEKFSLPLPEAR